MQWANRQAHQNPQLFPSLARGQRPQILWIGCSDSRVPETTILDLLPGDVFVHRNMGNIIDARDMSVLSAIEFAVETLAVKHIIICGIFFLSLNLMIGHSKCAACATVFEKKNSKRYR